MDATSRAARRACRRSAGHGGARRRRRRARHPTSRRPGASVLAGVAIAVTERPMRPASRSALVRPWGNTVTSAAAGNGQLDRMPADERRPPDHEQAHGGTLRVEPSVDRNDPTTVSCSTWAPFSLHRQESCPEPPVRRSLRCPDPPLRKHRGPDPPVRRVVPRPPIRSAVAVTVDWRTWRCSISLTRHDHRRGVQPPDPVRCLPGRPQCGRACGASVRSRLAWPTLRRLPVPHLAVDGDHRRHRGRSPGSAGARR